MTTLFLPLRVSDAPTDASASAAVARTTTARPRATRATFAPGLTIGSRRADARSFSATANCTVTAEAIVTKV